MAKDIYIVGTSGQAKEIVCLINAINRVSSVWNVVGFISESAEANGSLLVGRPVVACDTEFLAKRSGAAVAIGIGHPAIRKKVFAKYSAHGFDFPNLLHPRANLDPGFIKLGQGNIVCAGAFISCDVSIGDANLFNWQVTVGHDASIGSFNVVHPSANISGNVAIGDSVLVGVGSQILEGRRIGNTARIGAGAVVSKDVESGSTVVGIPAKAIH